MTPKSFESVRRRLDDLGFYQTLVPESLPLVEALLHELSRGRNQRKQADKKKGKV